MALPINLLDYDRNRLQALFEAWGEHPQHALTILQALHRYGETDFLRWQTISKSLRQKLVQAAQVILPEIAYDTTAQDGTRKWLLRLTDGNCIETVFIPEANRGTLCVSSQVGCMLNCQFCQTAKVGFNRNLTTAEIIAQVWVAIRCLSQQQGKHDGQITNVVFMGMGEPLLNLTNVLPALRLLLDDNLYGLSKHRVTVSTSGVIPGLLQLKRESTVALAVSLHAPNDELRNELVPLNKKYQLADLLAVCRDYYPANSGRVIFFEYVMLREVNDTPNHAEQLINILQGIPGKVNLIPFNTFPKVPYQPSYPEVIQKFSETLKAAGVVTTIRKTRGDEIIAACGQLAGRVQDKTSRQRRWQAHSDGTS